MNHIYLLDSKYDNERNRMILFFSKDPLSKKFDFVLKEKFNPYLYIDLPKELVYKLLNDFKKEIKIEVINKKKIKLISKNYNTLQKCAKIINTATSKNILLIKPERQFLIQTNWSYYDMFVSIGRNKIKKIDNNNTINQTIKRYIKSLTSKEQPKLIQSLTKRLLLSNILKVKPEINIKNDEIMNILFENNFFRKKLVLKNKSKIEYTKPDKIIKNSINLDFSNIWPYLLQNEFYNLGYDTFNCDCCKPNEIISTNTLSSSMVEIEFQRNGYYFISKDRDWANNYHRTNLMKENRINYVKLNKIKQLPTGPFFQGNRMLIPLIDCIPLLEEKDIKLTNQNNKLNWYCTKEQSFISELIHEIKERLEHIEQSINLSTFANYSTSISSNLETNPNFIQYITKYKLLNDLLEEIPRFMEHTNTKFYDPIISRSIKLIKKETLSKVNTNNYRIIEQEKRITTKEKAFIKQVNNYFPKMNLPIPRLITT